MTVIGGAEFVGTNFCQPLSDKQNAVQEIGVASCEHAGILNSAFQRQNCGAVDLASKAGRAKLPLHGNDRAGICDLKSVFTLLYSDERL